jgi:uncharacterized protein (DUF1778 family)
MARPPAWLTVRIGDGGPVAIRLTPEQKAEVERYAALGGESVSDWVRDVLDAARGAYGHAEAAERACLDLRTWARIMVLEAAYETELGEQLGNVLVRALEPK